MEFVLATLTDLSEIKNMYNDIVKNMYKNGIKIWNEYYPNEEFESDIKKQNLYLLKKDSIILGAIVLDKFTDTYSGLEFENVKEKAYLLNRLGVNVNYLHQGIGKTLIEEAAKVSKQNGAKYLRLLVSEVNTPAINLYFNCGFKKVTGVYKEKIKEDVFLMEYGFEMLL